MPFLQLLRPGQWIKNLFLFAGVVFGHKVFADGHLQLGTLGLVVLGFVCFCLVSSGVYVLNDIHDRDEDRLHPRKRTRPLAAGQIGVGSAAVWAVGLLAVGLTGALLLSRGFLVIAAAYVLLQIAYTLWLKHATLLDVTVIGLGFVLRAVGGAVLVNVPISPWLVVCTFTLCLFMGFSKRRCELNAMAGSGNDAAGHRRTLAEYTPDLLNHMTTLSAAIAVVSFMLYAMDKRTLAEFGTDYLIYTLPLVVYAVFRFALLVEHGRVDGPTTVVLKDRPFQAAVAAWALAALLIVYQGPLLRAWLRQVLDRGTP